MPKGGSLLDRYDEAMVTAEVRCGGMRRHETA